MMRRLRTLAEALDDASTGTAGYTFVGERGPLTRSCADIRASAHRVAAGLQRAGLERGDVVALVIADAEQFLTTLIGAAICGIMPASLYPPATAADLSRFFTRRRQQLTASEARAIVTTKRPPGGLHRAAQAAATPRRRHPARGLRTRRLPESGVRRWTTSPSFSTPPAPRRCPRAWC